MSEIRELREWVNVLELVLLDVAYAFDRLPDDISIYRAMAKSKSRKRMMQARAVADELDRSFGHIGPTIRALIGKNGAA